MTRSASCSIAPDSRRSDSRGSFDSRISGWRLSWRERDDRDAELAGEGLEPARDLRHLLDAVRVAVRRRRLHQLEVVDDHEVQPGLRLEAAGLRPELHRADVRRVVDVHRRLGQGVHRRRDPREVHLLEEARPEALAVDVRDAREQPQDELLLAHLEAEDADALLLADRRVLGDVEREARLADAGPGRDDDEVALLEAGRQRIEVREAGPDAADLAAVGVQVVEPVVGLVEERLQRGWKPDVDPLLADREQLRLGPVDRLLDLGGILVADAGDPARRADQVPQDRLALDDPGVLDGVDRGGRLVREARQVGPAADRLELVRAARAPPTTVTMSIGSRRSNSSRTAAKISPFACR